MSAQPHSCTDVDPETALKSALQHVRGDRVQIVEGVIEPVSPSWDHEAAADSIRAQIAARLGELGCVAVSDTWLPLPAR